MLLAFYCYQIVVNCSVTGGTPREPAGKVQSYNLLSIIVIAT